MVAGQQWRCRHKEQTCEHSQASTGWDNIYNVYWNIYITIWKTDSQRYVTIYRGGREVQEGGDICIPMADSYRGMAETNTILQSNYPPIKNKFKGNKHTKKCSENNAIVIHFSANIFHSQLNRRWLRYLLLLWYFILVKVYEENLASYRYVFVKSRSTFTYLWIFFLNIISKLAKWQFLKS